METVTYNSGKYKGLTATGKDWDENEIQQDCEADECFGLKSFEQGDLVWKKLNHLLKKVK